jgi:hypothetical protein
VKANFNKIEGLIRSENKKKELKMEGEMSRKLSCGNNFIIYLIKINLIES